MASVKCGRIDGSDRKVRQDMGPLDRYVSRNSDKASLLSPIGVIWSIRITVSGERSPWAVENVGRMSQLARTELDSDVPTRFSARCSAFGPSVPVVERILCVEKGVVWEAGDSGTYIVIDR